MKCIRAAQFLFAAALTSITCLGDVTRIEENDPSISYTGTWYSNSSTLHSGGGAALTNAKGSQATLAFNGTGVIWYGVADPWAGVARVYLDGVMSTVDTYGPATKYQQTFFVARNLTAGPHTLSIEVTHMRDVDGSGSWVWIDCFDVENGSGVTGGITATSGRIEQNNPAVIYTGDWFTNTNPIQSGGSAALAVDAGSRVTVSFTGTSIKWIGYRDEWSGIAKVYLDGAFNSTVDTYLTPWQAQNAVFSVSGLASAAHSLTIEVTGTHSAASQGSWIWVDAFDVQ